MLSFGSPTIQTEEPLPGGPGVGMHMATWQHLAHHVGSGAGGGGLHNPYPHWQVCYTYSIYLSIYSSIYLYHTYNISLSLPLSLSPSPSLSLPPSLPLSLSLTRTCTGSRWRKKRGSKRTRHTPHIRSGSRWRPRRRTPTRTRSCTRRASRTPRAMLARRWRPVPRRLQRSAPCIPTGSI